MGILATLNLAVEVSAGEKTRAEALSEHFSRNFFRPLSEKWLPVALAIIKRFETDEDLSYEVDNPVKGGKLVAEQVVEDLHLAAFLPLYVIGS